MNPTLAAKPHSVQGGGATLDLLSSILTPIHLSSGGGEPFSPPWRWPFPCSGHTWVELHKGCQGQQQKYQGWGSLSVRTLRGLAASGALAPRGCSAQQSDVLWPLSLLPQIQLGPHPGSP